MELNRKNIRKILLIITFTILLFVVAQNLNTVSKGVGTVLGYFSPVITGLCLAFVLNIFLSALENHVFHFMRKSKKKIVRQACRPLCIALCLIFIFSIISILIFGIIPEFTELFNTLSNTVPSLASDAMTWVEDKLSEFNIALDTLPNYAVDWDKFFDTIINFLTNSSDSLVGGAVNVTTSIVSAVVNTIFSIAIAVYVIAKKERIGDITRKTVKALIPEKMANSIFRFASLTYSAFSNFISGQFTEALIFGSLCFVGMLILRLPNAAIISMLVGVTAIVPIVGAFVGTVVGALLILIESPFKALIFIIFIIVLQQIDNTFIYPRVVGKSVGLPGVIVFSAVLVGGNIASVVGALAAVPIAAVLYTLLLELIEKQPVQSIAARKKGVTQSVNIATEDENKDTNVDD